MHLLHLDSSARTTSFSRRLGAAFREEWDAGAGTTTTYRDLAAAPVPPISEAWTEICDNLMRDRITALEELHLGARTPRQRAAWGVVAPLLAELVAADVVLLGVPMYNYGVPASLKAWFDQVTFPRMDLGHRRFVVVGSRGGTYAAGAPKAPFEHHTRYLADLVQGHFAVPPPTEVVAELANAVVDPLLGQHRDAHEESLAAALDEARRCAATLLAGRPAAGATSR